MNISHLKKEIIIAGGLFWGVFFYMFASLGFLTQGLNVPYTYEHGDTMQWCMLIKTVGEHGWFWTNPQLAAPFGFTAYDYTAYFFMNFDLFIMKILYFFTHDCFVCINIWYILCFSFSTFTAYLTLCLGMKQRRILSVFGALIFGFAPFIQDRGLGHIPLSACYSVPFTVLLCYWCLTEGDDYLCVNKDFLKNKKNIISIIMAVMIINYGEGYGAFFTCFLLCVTALCCFFSEQGIRSVRKPVIMILIILLFSIICLVPVIVYSLLHGANVEIASRSVADGEIYGLKVAMFFIPLNGHGIPVIEHLIKNYQNGMPLINENRSAYLGLGPALGFIFGLVLLFTGKKTKELNLLSCLNISAVLLATIGGFSALISMYFHLIRGYNRISIYIMFSSIVILLKIVEMILNKVKEKSSFITVSRIVICLLFALFLLEELPVFDIKGSRLLAQRQLYDEDKRFYEELETVTQDGDMIYTLPYRDYPEDGGHKHLTGYLLTDNGLRWSYGGTRGREAAMFNREISEMEIDDMIESMRKAGYKGICIDKEGYESEEADDLIKQIGNILNTIPIENEYNAFFKL